MQLSRKPYDLLNFFGLIIVVTAFIFNKLVILHIYDTYFVLRFSILAMPVALLLCVIWLIYNFTNRILWSKTLIWIHVLSTLVFAILVLLLLYTNRYPQLTLTASRFFKSFERLNFILNISLESLLAIQLLFFANVFAGLIQLIPNRRSTIP